MPLLTRRQRLACRASLALVLASPLAAADEADPAAPPPAIVSFGVGPALARRSFAYHDGLFGDLRSYSLRASGGVAARLALFPAARTTLPGLAALGLVGSFHQTFGLQSQDSGGQATTTLWRRLDAGLRYRLVASPQLDVTVGYGAEIFSFSGAVAAGAPAVDYRYLSGALGGAIPLGPASLELRAAFHRVLDGGGVAARLRETTVAGVDGWLGIHLPLFPGFSLSAGGQYTRYFYSFRPAPGDSLVAGGALDQSIRASLLAVGSF